MKQTNLVAPRSMSEGVWQAWADPIERPQHQPSSGLKFWATGGVVLLIWTVLAAVLVGRV
jgi:hypothetical protein